MKDRREPLLALALEKSLLALDAESPQIEPLLALPPTFKSLTLRPVVGRLLIRSLPLTF